MERVLVSRLGILVVDDDDDDAEPAVDVWISLRMYLLISHRLSSHAVGRSKCKTRIYQRLK